MFEQLKDLKFITMFLSLVYIAVLQPESQVVIGVFLLNLLNYAVSFQQSYNKLNQKVEKPKTELEETIEKMKLEEAKIRLEKLESRDVKVIGMGRADVSNLGF